MSYPQDASTSKEPWQEGGGLDDLLSNAWAWVRQQVSPRPAVTGTPIRDVPVTPGQQVWSLISPAAPAATPVRPSWFDYERAMAGAYPRNVTGGMAPGSYDYRAMQEAAGAGAGSEEDLWKALFEELFGAGAGGGGGSGSDDAINWARLEQDRLEFAQQLALEREAMAQQAELARLSREQQQRQFAAQLGQALNELMSQNWESALPWTLPSGTEYAPGFEPGGAVANLARIGGAEYTPQRLAVSNPPSRETLNQWLNDAIALWGK